MLLNKAEEPQPKPLVKQSRAFGPRTLVKTDELRQTGLEFYEAVKLQWNDILASRLLAIYDQDVGFDCTSLDEVQSLHWPSNKSITPS